MSSNTSIKIGADTSTFEAQLNKLKTTISQFGDKLKSESGKADFNFKGAKKELDELVKVADKLTAALDKGDKTSKNYAKNLKAMQDAMEQAAKVAVKLENAGTAKSSKVSSYFRGYAGELGSEHSSAISQSATDAALARVQSATDARHAKLAARAGKLIGFAGGAALGGGGGYSQLGSAIGGMLPGPLGFVGNAIGGMVGGAADRYIGGARDEARVYSELRRGIGSTTNDFEKLRDSVRSVISGLGVTDNEAANLARQFARTASLTGNNAEYIAKSVGTGAGFAQGYGMAPAQAVDFFASMRLNGVTKNDADSRRLALMIGESVQRGGTSAKMDEVLSAVSGAASHFAQNTLTAPNVGQYASYLASMTGSGYAGIAGNPTNAAMLMASANAAVENGGTMGEASQYHWLRARKMAFSGMSVLDDSIMQGAGLTGDLSGQFTGSEPGKPGSAIYDNADPATKAHFDKLRAQIANSGFSNNFKVGMEYIKKISRGNSYLENENFRGMFGGNPQQAAALMQRFSRDPGLGGFESKLNGYGVNLKNLNVSQIASMSELVGGGTSAMAKQYEKLLGSGKLSAGEVANADKIMGREGYGENFKSMLLKLTEKYDADDGLKSQTTQIDIQNKIQDKVSALVGIETDARNILLELLKDRDSKNPLIKSIRDDDLAGIKNGIGRSGKDMAGNDMRDYDDAMEALNSKLLRISQSKSPEQRSAYSKMLKETIESNPGAWPAESMELLNRAMGVEVSAASGKGASAPGELPTISGRVAPYKKSVVDMATNPSQYDGIFEDAARATGLPAAYIKMVAAKESGLNPNAINSASGDYGMMQHNSRYMGERGLNMSNWNDPRANIMAGARFLKQQTDRYGMHDGLMHYNGSGAAARQYADEGMATWDAIQDQMPKRRTPQQEQERYSRHEHVVKLFDSGGKPAASDLVIPTYGAPIPEGAL